MKDTVNSRDNKIRDLRKSYDEFTDVVVSKLNNINRLLIDIEQEGQN